MSREVDDFCCCSNIYGNINLSYSLAQTFLRAVFVVKVKK